MQFKIISLQLKIISLQLKIISLQLKIISLQLKIISLQLKIISLQLKIILFFWFSNYFALSLLQGSPVYPKERPSAVLPLFPDINSLKLNKSVPRDKVRYMYMYVLRECTVCMYIHVNVLCVCTYM